ncbi:CgeB family protein [Stutzerimonas nitrititolerans]|uniref:CgeB family protein n=1 Tax=Stutzerimonas nitrititolerans TaxID=2482751 RepID=UPI0028A61E94|nr:glycosyltransferase [Stutzerimonas nitrititolerans]
MIDEQKKFFIIDGIGGVPLGRELHEAFSDQGILAVYLDALRQRSRPFYGVRSGFHKARNKLRDKAAFHHLPRLQLKELEEEIRREKPTHILVIGFLYKHYDPVAVKRLAQEVGAKFLIYDTDSCNLYSRQREFVFFLKNELPLYDVVFSFSKVTTRFFRDTLGLNARHLPFGAKVMPERIETPKLEVLFVGSADLRRIFLLEHIREWLVVRGARWRRNYPLMSAALRLRVDDRPVWGEELLSLLQDSHIVLNITRSDFYGAETGVNLRIFEALAAGCFLLTDYCEEIAEIFKPGEQIEVFHSATELREKVEYYLANPRECERIARLGHAEFLAAHCWSARVRQILAQTASLQASTA